MALFTAALADYCSTHLGVINDVELKAIGVTAYRRRALIESEILVPVHRRVYRLRSTPVTLEGRCRAVCLANPSVVITGRAAGKLWGLRRIGQVELVEARAPYFSNTFADEGVRLRRCPPLPPVDIVVRTDGIRVVSPPRLAFDLAAVLSDLDGRLAWLKPVDSHHELRLYDALRRSGVAGMTRQHRLELPGGWPIHADIAVPSLQWAIPIDHVTWHGGRIDARNCS
jgi:hypothetical protein